MTLSNPPARLVLADGAVFEGDTAVAGPPASGEVVFNTSLTGYQEVFSDPSYAGQVVAMTAPHIGNYGTNPDDDESSRPAAAGFVVRSMSRVVSNHRATEALGDWLGRHGVPAATGIDTRRLTRHIRDAGAMAGGLFTDPLPPPDECVDRVRAAPGMEGRNLVPLVTTPEAYTSPERPAEARYRVALVDFGVKRTILRRLAAAGCDVVVHPAATPADVVLAGEPDGVMLSNGPGDPAAVTGAAETVRALLGRVPVFGICLGHQITGLALGARTVKLPFGHHGANHPVKHIASGHVEITAQNHGFAVEIVEDGGSPFGGITMTHVNLNDGTLEGLCCQDVPAFSVQYHPEAGPGPHDAAYLFAEFTDLMERHRARPA